MQIKRLVLGTSELQKIDTFYRSILGLPVRVSNNQEIQIGIGSTELVFKSSASDPFYHFAINIPSYKILDARAWMSQRQDLIWMEQYSSDIAEFASWHARSVYFFDPAGNIVELIARNDLSINMGEPFSEDQMLSVSEVGIVCKTNELEMETGRLISEFGLGYFDRQPPLQHFKALGDHEGLFILVPEHRNWFPTLKPAKRFEMEIEFVNVGEKFRLAYA